jgi:uncharacterized protein (DUF4415 family)
MRGKKRSTAANYQSIGKSDLKKIDEYVLGPKDYEEIPELTDEWFKRATWHIGGVPVPRGRPKSAAPKRAISLRLDDDVVAHFRRSGRGWQSRINAALRKAAKLPKEKRKKA